MRSIGRLGRLLAAGVLALAAIIPLPFSPMMWVAGIIGMPLERVVIIALLRIVKTAFYLWLIVLGWGMT